MIVAHLDMDAFFASVEERENPRFAGFGIVVGADPKNGYGRGVVSTANYQARKYGIHSAMPISTAWQLAKSAERRGNPKTIFLPVNMDYYAKVSQGMMRIIVTLLHGYIAKEFLNQQSNNLTMKQFFLFEQTSIDEAYLDLSFCLLQDTKITYNCDRLHMLSGQYDAAKRIIGKIKEEIWQREKLTASVGIGPNKLIAKMASARFKPNGLTVIKPDEVGKFLDPLPIGDIPGIGPKSEEFFHKKKIFKVVDLKEVSKEQLKAWLGKWGSDIWGKARGIDESKVTVDRKIRSISEQETFEVDTISAAFIIGRLERLATRVIERMKDEDIASFKTVTIVVRFADFTTKNRAHTLTNTTDSLKILKNEAIKLLLPFLDRRENPKLKKIRLIGVGIEHFKKKEVKISNLKFKI